MSYQPSQNSDNLPIERERSSFLKKARVSDLLRPQTKIQYMPEVDGMRALAIIFVILWHGSLRVERKIGIIQQNNKDMISFYEYLPHGEIGVCLFFVLCGLVMAKSLKIGIFNVESISTYYLRRLKRLYPPFIIAFAISVLPSMLNVWQDKNVHQLPYYESILASLTYVHGILYNFPSRFNPPTWSLEVEVQFFILCPFIMVFLNKSRDYKIKSFILVLLGLTIIVVSGVVHSFIPFDGRFRFGLLAHAHLFIFGIALSFLNVSQINIRGKGLFDLLFLAGICLLVGSGVILTKYNAEVPGGIFNVIMSIAVALACSLIFIGARFGLVSKIAMSNELLRIIGSMSYSIYLIHIIVIEAVAVLLKKVNITETIGLYTIHWLFYIVLLVPASLLFYILAERPFMVASQNFSKQNVNNVRC